MTTTKTNWLRVLAGYGRVEPVEKREYGNRTVRIYPYGVRRVVEYYGDGEAWSEKIIVPRKVINEIIAGIKANPQMGLPRDLLGIVPFLRGEYHGQPGGVFIRRPYIHTKNRRFLVAAQSGGLDI